MRTFLKAQFSSLLATGVDFLFMICLVEVFGVHYVGGVIFGALGGAVTNFLVNRYWSFGVAGKPIKHQGIRYMLVWTGSVLLNVSGVYLLARFFKVNYILAKITVSIIVGLSFNYVLQKKYVFSTR